MDESPFMPEVIGGQIHVSDRKATELLYEARALEKKGNYDEAMAKYDEAVALDDQLAKAWFYKSRLHQELGQLEEATHCAQKAVDIDPKWAKFIKKTKTQGEQASVQSPAEEKILEAGWMPDDLVERGGVMGLTRELMEGMAENISTEIEHDGRIVPASRLNITYLGIATKGFIGKGSQKIKSIRTGEEWIIERTVGKIIIHSHKEPQFLDPILKGVGPEYRLILALDELGVFNYKQVRGY